uniref:Uncharacterized protein n=1 Tax=Globodera rostochiensis TaxID=31243 RepID=A0A914IB72_GLORO
MLLHLTSIYKFIFSFKNSLLNFFINKKSAMILSYFHHLLLFLFFSTFTVLNGVCELPHYDCYDFLLPYERFSQNEKTITKCPSGLEWHNSVQLCCTSSNNLYRPAAGDRIFYQQRYSLLALPGSDTIPKKCIRALHFPNESLVSCGATSMHGTNQFKSIVSVPVKNNEAKNIYCCATNVSAKNIGIQNVYHGTIGAANYAINDSDSKTITIRESCNKVTIGNEKKDEFICPQTDVYDYNRQCCIPKFDADLTTAGEYKVEIKMRTTFSGEKIHHIYVIVGEYEYDYTSLGPRRRVFNHSTDALHQEDSPVKAKPFKQQPLYANSKKADNLFWEMGRRNFLQKVPDDEYFGWANSYDEISRTCVDFVYEFVCNLFDGNCPQEEVWPDNFVQIDRELNFSKSFKTETVSKYGNNPECSLMKYEFRIEYPLDKHSQHGSPIVEYETGVAVNELGEPYINSIQDVKLIQEIRVQQKCYIESMKNDGTIAVCKALLNICAKYVTGLCIWNSTLTQKLKEKLAEEKDGILDLSEIKKPIPL